MGGGQGLPEALISLLHGLLGTLLQKPANLQCMLRIHNEGGLHLSGDFTALDFSTLFAKINPSTLTDLVGYVMRGAYFLDVQIQNHRGTIWSGSTLSTSGCDRLLAFCLFVNDGKFVWSLFHWIALVGKEERFEMACRQNQG